MLEWVTWVLGLIQSLENVGRGNCTVCRVVTLKHNLKLQSVCECLSSQFLLDLCQWNSEIFFTENSFCSPSRAFAQFLGLSVGSRPWSRYLSTEKKGLHNNVCSNLKLVLQQGSYTCLWHHLYFFRLKMFSEYRTNICFIMCNVTTYNFDINREIY